MNVSLKFKAILVTLILGGGVLVACGSSASAPGGSASIALAQAHATATAEVAQTATAMIVEANRRNEEALARMTAVASAGLQSTLTVQEQQINALAISQAKSNATQQAALFRATATAISAQKTAQADMYTATAVAVRQNQNDSETASRFWSYFGFFIILLLVFGAGGGLLLIGWRFVVRHSFIPNPNGAGGVVVDYSPFDLLKPRAARTPSYQLLLPATASTPSAAPDASQDYMALRTKSGVTAMTKDDPLTTESREVVEWKKFCQERGNRLLELAWEHCRESGKSDSNIIPRWDTLKKIDGMMSARWWIDVTDVLEETGAVKKEPGKETVVTLKDHPTVVDLTILASRGKLFPLSPTSGWLAKRKKDWNSTAQHSSEQSGTAEQSEQTVFTKEEMDEQIKSIPGITR